MKPNIPKQRKPFILKTCSRCNGSFGPDAFSETKSFFYKDGYLPICNSCIEEYLVENNFDWEAVDKVCQYADIPFVPSEFERLHEMNRDKVFPVYAKVFLSSDYNGLDWGVYFRRFKELKEAGLIDDELPVIKEKKLSQLKEKWGANYDEEELHYLEGLYDGMLQTQNVNGALQDDQAKKLCKISLEIDSRIREGSDFDKILSSYDKLVKVAEFTPKNVKNATDFDSVGEVFRWLEKRGWVNKFYDGVTQDVVDETMKNIMNFNQRLYVNESGITEEIERRLSALKNAQELENYYNTDKEYDLDEYDNAGYDELMKDEDFQVELDDEQS
nr:MAG TPA: hypothetical protein [Caudoviricetes sp.]